MADQTFAVHCGFFDAINSDRTYSADEMNRPYKRVISNGVFATPQGTRSTDLQVVASSGMNIICKKGEGLFGDKWFENPSGIAITVPSNTGTVPRIDSVLVQVDTRTSGRVGNIVYRTGTPASYPVPPAINQTEGVVEYRLANIRVNAGVSAITQSMITDRRGSSDCPWVTSLIYQVDTSTLYDQWAAAYAEYFEEEKEIWDAWYEQLTEELDVTTNIVKLTNTVTTTSPIDNIPIGLDYNHNTDILEVFINGLRAVEGTQYVVNDDTSITLEKQLQEDQTVVFVVLKSVISGDISSIEAILQNLNDRINAVAGGTPTVVDSMYEMTDFRKLYILSSDSNWYYYDSTQADWVSGGVYGSGTSENLSPNMYGAKGDGVTDDSDALLACFTDAITKGKSIFIPSGTYICDNNKLVFELTDGQFLNVFGEGPTSCIKRKDQTADADWRILINISANSSNTEDISSIEFHHLKIDGNARNQPMPETNFGFEHSATLRIIGNSASRIKKVVVDDVVIDDNVADGLYIPGSGSAYIDDVFINDFVTYTRTRVRSDICFTGYPESIFVTNCKVPNFEFEYNTSPDVPTNVYISNLECETMDVIGTMRMEAVNLTVKTHCYLGRVLGNIADSYITISDRRIRIGDITFTNCEFHLTEIPAETEGDPPSVQALTIEYAGTKACFQKCRFVINGDAETYTGYLIKADISTILCVDNCEFDNRATGILADRCEKITVKNCVVSTPSLMNLMSSAAYPVSAVFDNLLILNTGRLGKLQPNSGSVLFNNVSCMGIDSAYIQRENSAWITDAVIRGSRKIYIDAPFTKELVSGKTGGVFLGDRYINTNALENEPMEWVRTQTFYATTNSTGYYRLHLRAIPNNPVGATADRPTSILGQGFQYYDTDLGKNIFWNGTAWTDAVGTVV